MKINCPCGWQISTVSDPVPGKLSILRDFDVDEITDYRGATSADCTMNWRQFQDRKIHAFECPSCGRLLVFGAGANPYYPDDLPRVYLPAEPEKCRLLWNGEKPRGLQPDTDQLEIDFARTDYKFGSGSHGHALIGGFINTCFIFRISSTVGSRSGISPCLTFGGSGRQDDGHAESS